MHSAFVLGAGLGTRLRPLTDRLPKPLVPVAGRPLITYAFDHLIGAGFGRFVVNTHHCAEAYAEAFPAAAYRGRPIVFRHEPDLLETGGGIANVADLLGGEGGFAVYNGDILTDLPVAPALAAHAAHPGWEVTLVLRTTGTDLHVAFDAASGHVTDIRNLLGTGARGSHQFTGIYFVRDPFLARLPQPPEKVSVIPYFLELARVGMLGGVVIDQGGWRDLGDPAAYLEAHRSLVGAPLVAEGAEVAADAVLEGSTVVGAGARISAGAHLTNTVVWPGATVSAGSRCADEIVTS